MKFAIVGGTHGNEPVGVEVIQALGESSGRHSFETMIGNPEAYRLGRRFVDSDLNRAFGKNGVAKGYELKRAKEIEQALRGNVDFIVDMHTTTSNMGATLILTHSNARTRQAAAYLKGLHPELLLLETTQTDEDCFFVSSNAPAGLIFELGPVANNVVRYDHFALCRDMIQELLEWDEGKVRDLSEVVHYKTYGERHVPAGYFIHPDREGSDFVAIETGDPLFINGAGEVICYQEQATTFPLFINEAAYQNDRLGMTFATQRSGFVATR